MTADHLDFFMSGIITGIFIVWLLSAMYKVGLEEGRKEKGK